MVNQFRTWLDAFGISPQLFHVERAGRGYHSHHYSHNKDE